MRHATPAGLERIGDLLTELRDVDGLVERTPGVFYRRSRAFHEDPAGMFADVRLTGDDFVRLRVTSHVPEADIGGGLGTDLVGRDRSKVWRRPWRRRTRRPHDVAFVARIYS